MNGQTAREGIIVDDELELEKLLSFCFEAADIPEERIKKIRSYNKEEKERFMLKWLKFCAALRLNVAEIEKADNKSDK